MIKRFNEMLSNYIKYVDIKDVNEVKKSVTFAIKESINTSQIKMFSKNISFAPIGTN